MSTAVSVESRIDHVEMTDETITAHSQVDRPLTLGDAVACGCSRAGRARFCFCGASIDHDVKC
jgi:hypothetical protein